jgi:hypothetical protein
MAQPGSKLSSETLMNALRFGGLDRENLADIVRSVSVLEDFGMRAVKVFPLGIPATDGAQVHTILDAERLGNLIKALRELPRISGVRVFPKGIPVPDLFLTEIDFR